MNEWIDRLRVKRNIIEEMMRKRRKLKNIEVQLVSVLISEMDRTGQEVVSVYCHWEYSAIIIIYNNIMVIK